MTIKMIKSNVNRNEETEEKTKRKKYLKLTLKSDLNVGCAIPMEDVCCKRFGVPLISAGLFRRIPTGGGGGAKNPEVADGGNEVTVAISTHQKKTLSLLFSLKKEMYKFQ